MREASVLLMSWVVGRSRTPVTNVDPSASAAKPEQQHHQTTRGLRPAPLASLLAALAIAAPTPARAVDGCTVLLCLAAPSWRAVPQCVPPIRQLLRDLARGKSFPTCGFAGNGNTSTHTWSNAPSFCPPQYTRQWDGPNGPVYSCDYDGAISVTVNGVPFSQTWWSMAGDAVTEFSSSAKTQLGTWDTRFEADFAAWLALQPPPLPGSGVVPR